MPANEPNHGNQKVTNAVLSLQIEALATDVREVKADIKEGLKEHDTRITANREDVIIHTQQIRNRSLIAAALQAIGTTLGIVWK